VRIIVNHLTRMAPGFICVAGIDSASNAHIRPVLPGGKRLSTQTLVRNGRVFDIATEVDLGRVTNVGRAPELEDRIFDLSASQIVRDELPADEFWTVLTGSAQTSLKAIFGNDLKNAGRSAALDENTGNASLGCLIPDRNPTLRLATYGNTNKVEMILEDRDLGKLIVAVTDLRFYRPPDFGIRAEVLDRYQRELDANVPTVLSMGVARKYKKPNDEIYRHWLQVNNVHLQSAPNQQDRNL
jgi:hypothetical protein